ncbi:MAG: hypothetical protein WD066_12630 [Planctomycetaceae bacterium]
MARRSVALWLREKVRREARLSLAGGLALFALGAALLWLTYWAAYGLAAFYLEWMWPDDDALKPWAALALVGLLFVGNALLSRAYLDHLEMDLDPHHSLKLGVFRATGFGWAYAFSSPARAHASFKMILTILFVGPRAMMGAWRSCVRARELQQVDVKNCVPVLRIALHRQRRVPFVELADTLPDVDWQSAVRQLSLLDGVVFLPSEPAGLAVTPSFADEFERWRDREPDDEAY